MSAEQLRLTDALSAPGDERTRAAGDDAGDGWLATLRRAGVLLPGDVHVARAVARLTGDGDPRVLLAAALAVRAPRYGHVCLDLERVHAEGLAAEGEPVVEVALPEVGEWRAALAASPAVGLEERPLVLDGHRLYLDRYWRYEQRLVEGVGALVARRPDDRDPARVAAALDRLFPDAMTAGAPSGDDPQRRAAEVACRRALTVVTGGPGTGKTTTVVRLLAALLLSAPDGPPPRMVLAAPTGKAAARLQEALAEALEGGHLAVDDEVRAALGEVTASTLHRLLGFRPDNTTRFRRHAGNPLPYDVVVVDEASMASLPLMAKLLDAIADGTRLVLVGDRDQLASVEAGAVLGDVCGPRERTGRAERAGTDDIAGCVVELTRFHRFGPDSGIGAVARAIQRVDDDAEEVLEILRGTRVEVGTADGTASGSPDTTGAGPDRTVEASGGYRDVRLVAPQPGAPLPEGVLDEVVSGYRRAVEAALAGDPPQDVLSAFEELRVLCALRRGPEGAEALNLRLETALAERVPGYRAEEHFPVGRPLMVTRNDYGVRLFNGDVGVVVGDPEDPDRRLVAFPTVEGPPRLMAASRLPGAEAVWAMSVHKSQGSQYGRVVVVLPTVDTPAATRELVYTAVTRARTHVTVVAGEPLLATALGRRVQRASGLAERLWGRSL
jgi:exodeoxyribonuclease V alpha subunit